MIQSLGGWPQPVLPGTVFRGPYHQHFLPFHKFLSGLTLNVLFKQPILSRDAGVLEMYRGSRWSSWNGFRHVPYEVSLQPLRLFFLTHLRIRRELIFMFMMTICDDVHSFFWIPYGIHLHPSNPHNQCVYPSSPIRFQCSNCLILE